LNVKIIDIFPPQLTYEGLKMDGSPIKFNYNNHCGHHFVDIEAKSNSFWSVSLSNTIGLLILNE